MIRWTRQNLLDTTVYYPLAIVRDTRTDTVLDTIALDVLDSNRWAAQWNVVGDPSGQGREVEIEITIYEDSAHTQVSGIYGRWTETYLIVQLQATQTGGSGGSYGSTVDYEYIGRVIKENIREAFAGSPEVRPDMSGVESRLGDAGETMKEHARDFASFTKSADAVREAIGGMRQILGRILTAIKDLPSEMQKTSEKASADASTALGAAAKEASGMLTKAAEESARIIGEKTAQVERRLENKTDEELDHIVSKFKQVMDAEGTRIAEATSTKITGTLDKLRLSRTTESYDLKEKEPKIEEDGRGRRFLSYASD